MDFAQHRRNSLYSHPTSQARREDEARTIPDPIQAMRARHRDERAALVSPFQGETAALDAQHAAARANHGARVPEALTAAQAKARRALDETHEKKLAALSGRQAKELEAAVAKYGAG